MLAGGMAVEVEVCILGCADGLGCVLFIVTDSAAPCCCCCLVAVVVVYYCAVCCWCVGCWNNLVLDSKKSSLYCTGFRVKYLGFLGGEMQSGPCEMSPLMRDAVVWSGARWDTPAAGSAFECRHCESLA